MMALGLEVEFAVLNHEGARHIAEPACLAFIPEVFRVSRPVELVTRLDCGAVSTQQARLTLDSLVFAQCVRRRGWSGLRS